MPTLGFLPERGGRRSEAEVLAEARRLHNVTLVNGLDQVADSSAPAQAEAIRPAWRAAAPAASWRLRLREGERLAWTTFPVPAALETKRVVLVFAIAMGNGSPLPEPGGQFDLLLDGQKLLSFRLVKHTETWRKGDAGLCLNVRRLDAARPGEAIHVDPSSVESFVAFGYGLLQLPASQVKPGQPVRLAIVPRAPIPSNRWLQIDRDPHLLETGTFQEGLDRVCHWAARWRVGEYTLLFGDLHSHSGLGRDGDGSGSGTGTPRENFLYARDVANLDLYALTDHDYEFASSADWELRSSLAQEFYKPGEFVTFPAFEWSSERFGHRGVYYEEPDPPYFMADRAGDPWSPLNDNPNELWRKLGELQTGSLTIPFHPALARNPMVWDYRHPKLEPVAEVYSCLGSAEGPNGAFAAETVPGCDLRAALAAGARVGFIASSNSHDGHPGDSQGGRSTAYYHARGSGRLAVYAKEFNRTGVLEALRARRVYATTGEPIFLDFRLNDHRMGSELRADQVGRAPQLLVHALGTCEIHMIQILCNGRVVGIQFGDGVEEGIAILDSSFSAAQPRVYYARVVQRDGETAWSSPIWVG